MSDCFEWKERARDIEKEWGICKNGVNQFLSRLMAMRNVDVDSPVTFLESNYQQLSEPAEKGWLYGCFQAAKLVKKYNGTGATVLIVGDYDADGILSSVMLERMFYEVGCEAEVFIPSRFDHGYGLNDKTIKSVRERLAASGKRPKMLVTTDCGTNSVKEILSMKDLGIEDVMVIDHHIPDQNLDLDSLKDEFSNYCLVNWHYGDDFPETCACGQVFHLIRALRHLDVKVSPWEYICYAAIGLIADSSPILGDNRIIVRNGLSPKAINGVTSAGLHALLEVSKVNPEMLTQNDVSFWVAPRINAPGRMGDATLAFRLFTTNDYAVAKDIAKSIDELNTERKQVQNEIIKLAESIAYKNDFSKGLVVGDNRWNTGVVGIVASKLAEKYHVPCLVVGCHNGVFKGSGRTVHGMDLKKIMDDCSDLFSTYGGHMYAAGFTVAEGKLDAMQDEFDAACKRYRDANGIDGGNLKFYDGSLNAKALTEKTGKMLFGLSPYCNIHNPEPIFKLKRVIITNIKITDFQSGAKLATFSCLKGGQYIKPKFKMFSPPFDESADSKRADIYFSFPQSWDPTPSPHNYRQFDMTVKDIKIEKD